MKKLLLGSVLGLFFFGAAHPAMAHFGMLIPSDSMIMQGDNRTVSLVLSFSHPFEAVGMDLAKPQVFGVMANGKKTGPPGRSERNKGPGTYGLAGRLPHQTARGVYVLHGAQALLGAC